MSFSLLAISGSTYNHGRNLRHHCSDKTTHATCKYDRLPNYQNALHWQSRKARKEILKLDHTQGGQDFSQKKLSEW